jgi:hypothetical protein
MRALTMQCERTLTVLLCARPAGPRGSSSLDITYHEQTRESPTSRDLMAAESDESRDMGRQAC